jgi:hypothetical protein
VIDEPYRERIFNVKAPHSFPTFLLDGRVAGIWKYEGGRVQLDPFERISRDARRELSYEAELLAAFHA